MTLDVFAAPDHLIVDEAQLARFIRTMFQYAAPGTWISLRGFRNSDSTGKAWRIKPTKIGADNLASVIADAVAFAQLCAEAPEGVVFAPPVCTFKSDENAKLQNLADGLAISVEIDADPVAARAKLEAVLGRPTIIVESGGQWTNPASGIIEPKLHMHWRLSAPAITKEDHARLKHARSLACHLVGADHTNISIVHPIRWPGSWHTKATPRLCHMIEDR